MKHINQLKQLMAEIIESDRRYYRSTIVKWLFLVEHWQMALLPQILWLCRNPPALARGIQSVFQMLESKI